MDKISNFINNTIKLAWQAFVLYLIFLLALVVTSTLLPWLNPGLIWLSSKRADIIVLVIFIIIIFTLFFSNKKKTENPTESQSKETSTKQEM